MTVSAYELRKLEELALLVVKGEYSQDGLNGRIVTALLTNMRNRNRTTHCYDAFLDTHGYTWVSGSDPHDDVVADLNLDDVLMTPAWTPTTVSEALLSICKVAWPQFFTAATLDVSAIESVASSL